MYCPDVVYRDAKHALVHLKRAAELDPRNAEYQVVLAFRYVDLAQPGEAKAVLDRATRMAPESADVYNRIADAYERRGDAKAALACVVKAIALDDRSSPSYVTLANVLLRLGERERALAAANKAYELMLTPPCVFDNFAGVASSFAKLGENEKALAAANKAYELLLERTDFSEFRTFRDAFTGMASLFGKLGENEKALAVLSKGIEVNPKPSDPGAFYLYNTRGDRYIDRQMYAAALADYDKSVELGSFSAWTYKRRALAHFYLKNYDKALADIAKAVELKADDTSNLSCIPPELVARCPDERLRTGLLELADKTIELTKGTMGAYKRRALVHFYLKNYDKALADIAKAVELKADDTSNLSCIPPELVARCPDERLRTGLLELADKTIELTKGTMGAYLARAKLYAAFGQPEKATADFDQAEKEQQAEIAALKKQMEQSSGNPEQRKQFAAQYFAIADVWFHIDQFERAFPHLDRAIEFDPEYSEAYDHRGYIYLQRGDLDRAIDDYTESIRFGAAYGVSSYSNRAAAFLNKGHYDRAIADLSKAVELDAGKANSWYRRALVRAAAGRAEDYRKDCVEMLQRFDRTENPGDAHWVAWACVLAPDATADWPKIVGLAEKAAESDSKSFAYQNTFGAVLYRAGRLDEAVRQLGQADRLANEPNQAVQSSPAYTWFFLAMAHHRLGHGEEAKTWLDKAVTSTEKALGEQKQGTADVPWNRRLTLKLLRDEAEALLKSTPAPPSPEPAAKEKEKTEEKRKAESGKRE